MDVAKCIRPSRVSVPVGSLHQTRSGLAVKARRTKSAAVGRLTGLVGDRRRRIFRPAGPS